MTATATKTSTGFLVEIHSVTSNMMPQQIEFRQTLNNNNTTISKNSNFIWKAKLNDGNSVLIRDDLMCFLCPKNASSTQQKHWPIFFEPWKFCNDIKEKRDVSTHSPAPSQQQSSSTNEYTLPVLTDNEMLQFLTIMMPYLDIVLRLNQQNEEMLAERISMHPEIVNDPIFINNFRVQFANRVQEWKMRCDWSKFYDPLVEDGGYRHLLGNMDSHYGFIFKWGTNEEKAEIEEECQRHEAQYNRLRTMMETGHNVQTRFDHLPVLQSAIDALESYVSLMETVRYSQQEQTFETDEQSNDEN